MQLQAKTGVAEADANEPRIMKLERLIKHSRLGIHDLSRIELDGATNTPRFNMPFELGLDMGVRMQACRSAQKHKKTLVLASAQYQYQVFLSNIAGQDIRSHQNDAALAIGHVRDFLEMNRHGDLAHPLAGPDSIVSDFADFEAALPAICAELKQSEKTMTMPEIITAMTNWTILMT